ncbi:MAG: hypothetical protein NW226_13660 [Microscillaceae bacterium]|nr:hypothetical protein [Microscillaceae bacterium]
MALRDTSRPHTIVSIKASQNRNLGRFREANADKIDFLQKKTNPSSFFFHKIIVSLLSKTKPIYFKYFSTHSSMRIYLDNCCFNRPFDDQSQIKIHLETQAKLYVQQQIKEQALELVWSYILDYENSFNPYEERQKIISEWQNFVKIDVYETQVLLENAEELVNLGIKAKDALHIACAIEAKCVYFLITDAILLKKKPKITQIELINPIDFVNL